MKALTDEMLHRLMDDELTPLAREQVLTLLADDEPAQLRLAELKRLKSRLSEELISTALPAYNPQRLPDPGLPGRSWLGIAAGLALTVGLGLGLMIGRQWPSTTRPVTELALGSHLVYAAEVRHPVEVGADEQAHLLTWLSKRLERDVNAPDLQRFGFRLLGGRLLAEGDKPAAQFMYERDDGVRVTLYLAQGSEAMSEFRFEQSAQLNAFFWQDKRITYALIGALNRDTLFSMAQASYQQL